MAKAQKPTTVGGKPSKAKTAWKEDKKPVGRSGNKGLVAVRMRERAKK